MRYLNSYVQQITLLIFLVCGGFSTVTMAQRVAVKTNLLEWATISPNIGAEFAIAPHWSIDFGISGNFGNPTSYKIIWKRRSVSEPFGIDSLDMQ